MRLTFQTAGHNWQSITGGQSELGTAVVTRLCDAGFKVFACLPEGECSAYAASLKEKVRDDTRLVILKMDRKQRNSIDACITRARECVATDEEIWGIVTFSAFPLIGQINWNNFDPDFKQVVEGDIIGLLHLVRECLPILRQCKGRMVNVTGSTSAPGLPIRCTAAISRSTSQSLMECVRREVAYFGIDVINVDADWGLHKIRDSVDGHLDENKERAKLTGARDLSAVADCVEQGLRSLFPEFKYRVSITKPMLQWFRSPSDSQ